MTQGRKWSRCDQGCIVQIGRVVTGAVKRAKRLALVLALVGVVTTGRRPQCPPRRSGRLLLAGVAHP
jgi:hypothetical protein